MQAQREENSKSQVLRVRKFQRLGEKAEESIWEVGQPCFVATKWEDETGGTRGENQAALRREKIGEI